MGRMVSAKLVGAKTQLSTVRRALNATLRLRQESLSHLSRGVVWRELCCRKTWASEQPDLRPWNKIEDRVAGTH